MLELYSLIFFPPQTLLIRNLFQAFVVIVNVHVITHNAAVDHAVIVRYDWVTQGYIDHSVSCNKLNTL